MDLRISRTLNIFVLAVCFIVLSGIILSSLTVLAAGSDEVNLYVTVQNARPSIGSISCHNSSTPLTPVAGENTTIWCYATITDANGYADVNQTSLNVTIWGTNSTGNGPYSTQDRSDDLNNHYSNGSSSHQRSDCTWYSASNTMCSLISDRKSTRLNSSHSAKSRMPSSA